MTPAHALKIAVASELLMAALEKIADVPGEEALLIATRLGELATELMAMHRGTRQ